MATLRERVLLDMNHALCELVDLEDLARFVVERSRALFAVETSTLLLIDDLNAAFHLCIAHHPATRSAGTAPVGPFVLDDATRNWLEHGRGGEIVGDTQTDQRWHPYARVTDSVISGALLCTSLRTPNGVVGAMGLHHHRLGTFNQEDIAFLDELSANIALAIENSRLYARAKAAETTLRSQVDSLTRELADRDPRPELVGNTQVIRALHRSIAAAASSSHPVLIEGEEGVGKDLVARAIHHASGGGSPRSFVTVSCAALPAALLESQLFGHRQGDFPGATCHHTGCFEAAEGGTVFLDDVDTLPLPIQARVLRTLQAQELIACASSSPRKLNTRVLSATSRSLEACVGNRQFHPQLLEHLTATRIFVPPLRARREDIPLLANHFLRANQQRLQRPVTSIDADALEALIRYDWPGNIRELQHVIERAVALRGNGEALSAEQFVGLGTISSTAPQSSAGAHNAGAPPPASLRSARAAFEAQHIRETMWRTGGNVSQAAKLLGLSRAMLHRKLKDLGVY